MSYDPLSEVLDEPLVVSKDAMRELSALRASDKFLDLPGINTTEERRRLSKIFDSLLDDLIQGISSNPSKLWVMAQFQRALEPVQTEDTEAREHFGMHLERIMDILCIESSDGLLSFYLGGI